jgi:hypothetical protein
VSIQAKTLALLLALSIVIATASTAFAQDNGYENGGEGLAGTLQGPSDQGGGDQAAVQATTAAPASGDGGSLPFTGLDVALILGVGGVLVAAGLVTRRLTRSVDAA